MKKQHLLHVSWLTGFCLLILLIGQARATPQDDPPLFMPLVARDTFFTASTSIPAYGVVFINSAEARSDAQQLAIYHALCLSV